MSPEKKQPAPNLGEVDKNRRKMAIVQCSGFRCLACLGQDGKWRDERGNVLDVLEVVNELP
jgi:hypothetical protein